MSVDLRGVDIERKVDIRGQMGKADFREWIKADFRAGFFLCAPKKNSRAPKLKKLETQEKNSNSRKNNSFPAFFQGRKNKYCSKI